MRLTTGAANRCLCQTNWFLQFKRCMSWQMNLGLKWFFRMIRLTTQTWPYNTKWCNMISWFGNGKWVSNNEAANISSTECHSLFRLRLIPPQTARTLSTLGWLQIVINPTSLQQISCPNASCMEKNTYIYHEFKAKCRYIFQTWSIWDVLFSRHAPPWSW